MPAWTLTRCSAVAPVPLPWLWPGYLPRGMLALLDGDPEQGKSLLTLDLAARLGTGRPLPDGSAGPPSPVTTVLLSAEDDPAATIRPRAEAAGADLDRLLVPTLAGPVPQFPRDLPDLEAVVTAAGAGFVVVDPLMAFLPPGVAVNLDQCVRQVLTPLAALAARTTATVLLV
ncbi:MAG: AAA family ATPase, partial [Gemmataceae bacterium]|nr:AAA family ATPase [Gemmataceae bacterium]